ncbi:hypothetical protein GGQ99_001305 [Aminobacter niigataensis]|uniref:Uncharacterized protein n=1 Tax=Aminobacter niigataensis TaxID=83265 RepID=A0ABR6KYG8_9HYPH|nr:hypothetical protein [Aminobacter niigataensis]MBB4649583.1 hypothetical protein [Aminobacter niigataensis]
MVRTFRSLFFGGLAMLAAAIFLSMPASALEREYGLNTPTAAAYVYVLPDVAPVDAILVAERQHEMRSRDAHAVAYAVANQPLTTWRIAVDSYSHIDPHIRAV